MIIVEQYILVDRDYIMEYTVSKKVKLYNDVL